MKRARGMHRIVAGVLSAALAGYQIPSTALAAAAASSSTLPAVAEIRGNVFAADGMTALVGVSVKAANMATHTIYSGSATGADGLYHLSDLPPGSYDLAVQTSKGIYAADALVEARAGRRTSVSLAIRPDAQEGQRQDPPKPPDPNAPEPPKKEGEGEKPPEQKPEEGKPADKPGEPEPQKPAKSGSSFWRSPAGAAIAIVAGAALIGVAANSAAGGDDEDTPEMTESNP